MKSVVRSLLAVLLIGLLTACGSGISAPNKQLVRQAIALQVSQTQQALTQQLRLPQAPKFEIKQVAIASQEPLVIENLPAFHIQGTYDLNLQLPSHPVTQQSNPFDVYLQRQAEGKTWRLAQRLPNSDGIPTWVTQLIQP